MLKANRYLGTTCQIPTSPIVGALDEAQTLYETEVTGEVEKYAWPGGYEIVYVFGDGEDVCADCVRTLLHERAESVAINRAGREDGRGYFTEDLSDAATVANLFDTSEVIVSWYSADSVDGCTMCAQCSRTIRICGHDDEAHADYCSFAPSPFMAGN